jgi:hypothetical protein
MPCPDGHQLKGSASHVAWANPLSSLKSSAMELLLQFVVDLLRGGWARSRRSARILFMSSFLPMGRHLWYAEIQSEWHRRRRSRVFRSIRSFTMDPFDWRFLILALQVFGTIRSACFDSELLFSRDSLSFPSYSATCSDS